jgi:hypothetical protein
MHIERAKAKSRVAEPKCADVRIEGGYATASSMAERRSDPDLRDHDREDHEQMESLSAGERNASLLLLRLIFSRRVD